MTKPNNRWRRLRRIAWVGMLLIVVAAGVALYLIRSDPAHWKQHQKFLATHTTQQIEVLAQEAEEALLDVLSIETPSQPPEASKARQLPLSGSQTTSQVDGDVENKPKVDPSMIRVDEIRKMNLTEEQLAALITARHEAWLKSRGYIKPPEITDPMLTLKDQQLVAAFKFETRQFSQVFTGKFNIKFQEDGFATLHMDSFQAGRLPIPADKIGEFMRKNTGGSTSAEKAGEWLSKMEEVRFKPVLDNLPHRRRARIKSYHVSDQGIELTLRVQDFRTYAEMNKRLEEQFADEDGDGENLQTAVVETP